MTTPALRHGTLQGKLEGERGKVSDKAKMDVVFAVELEEIATMWCLFS